MTELQMLRARALRVAALPVLVCLAYIFALRQGKPPGYDRDVIERLFTGDGFAPEPLPSKHPLLES